MAGEQLLLDFAVILIAAEIVGSAFRRIRLPQAVGILLAGFVLRPLTPGDSAHQSAVEDLADCGAVRGADLITASILIYDIVALSLMTFVVGLASPSPLRCTCSPGSSASSASLPFSSSSGAMPFLRSCGRPTRSRRAA